MIPQGTSRRPQGTLLVPQGTIRTPLTFGSGQLYGNIKKSNTVKQREGIFGTGRRRVVLLSDSTDYGAGTAVGPDVTGGTGTSAARFPLAPAAVLQPLLNTSICRTDIDTIMGGKTITTASGGAYSVYDTRTAGANWTLATGLTAGAHFFSNGNTGQSFTFTPPNTFDRVYIEILEPVAGQSIRIITDAGVQATFVATAAPDFTPVPYTVSVPAGSTFVTVQKAGGTGSIFWAALETYTSTNTGFSLVNGGWAGAACTTWTDATQVYSPSFALPILDYDVVILRLGLNDAVALGSNTTQFKTNYQALINILTAAGAEIVIATQTPCISSVITDDLQVSYRRAEIEIALVNDFPIINTINSVGTYADLVAAGIMTSDGVHWLNYARLANAYLGYFQQVKALGA